MSAERFESYRRYDGPESWDAIVIGSGIGGLTAAVLLGKYGGKKVLVLERHYVAGGFTHVFQRPGYDWDVGVHYIGDVGRDSATRRMFDAVSGGRLEWAPMAETYDRIFLGERSYDLVAGRERYRERLKEYFPSEAIAIDRYLQRLRELTRAAGGYFAEKAVPAPVALVAGGLMRRGFMKLASRTTRDVLEELTDHQELIAVLTGQFGDYGLPPGQSSFAIHAMVANHYMNGGWYPVGGAATIAASVRSEIESRGGKVLVSADVEEIMLAGGRAAGVRMSDGRVLRAPLVISNAGAAVTFNRLLASGSGAIAKQRDRARALGSSSAHLCLYLGLDATDAELGLESTNLWIYPDEKHDANWAAFLADPRAPLPLVYLSFPSSKDPDFQRRHPGHATIEALTLASYGWFAHWQDRPWRRRGAEYEELKEEFAERLLRVVYDRAPQVRGHVAIHELSTPLSTRNFVNYPRGEIYGLSHTPARFAARHIRPRTPIKGLYLTGQDICTCGVAGAMFGGAMTATAALGRPVIQKVLKG